MQEYFLKDLSVSVAIMQLDNYVKINCVYTCTPHGYNVIVIMAVNEIKTTLLCHCVTCLIDFWYEYFNEFCNVKSSPCPSNCNI